MEVELMDIWRKRFEENPNRHENLVWKDIANKLLEQPEKLQSLRWMEETGGEPDVIGCEEASHVFQFFDCSAESPQGRRSLCYDQEALEARKIHKPRDSAFAMANAMGVELLTEAQYWKLQQFGPFDTKTSSWIRTPDTLREKGGALFCDYRYGRVFTYHNGADSYYAARGFRALLTL